MVKVNVNMMIKVKVTMLLKVKVIKQVNTTFITTKQYNISDFQTLIYRHIYTGDRPLQLMVTHLFQVNWYSHNSVCSILQKLITLGVTAVMDSYF